MTFEPQNILLINFGQIGDVVLSLPAMRSLRERFPDSRLTLLVGASAKQIVDMSGLADEIVAVDRVELRDSNPIWSIVEIAKLTIRLWKKSFDFVIDLHSLPETNILGFLVGRRKRLFANRGTRSLNFLSNFRPRPPGEIHNLHITEFYARSLEPLNVKGVKEPFRIKPAREDIEKVQGIFDSKGISGERLIGINFGAGASSRRSSIASFGDLATTLQNAENYRVVLYSGPEEASQRGKFNDYFPENVPILDNLTLKELAAAFSRTEAVIGNDSGPIHLAGAVGVPIIMIAGGNGNNIFVPPTEELRIVESADLQNVDVMKVLEAVRSLVD